MRRGASVSAVVGDMVVRSLITRISATTAVGSLPSEWDMGHFYGQLAVASTWLDADPALCSEAKLAIQALRAKIRAAELAAVGVKIPVLE